VIDGRSLHDQGGRRPIDRPEGRQTDGVDRRLTLRQLAAGIALAASVVSTVACSPQAGPSASPTSDFADRICDTDVAKAALTPHDTTALDDAIRDCLTMDRLSATLSRHPGYLDPAATNLAEFVENRCEHADADDSSDADLDESIICSNLPTPS
jgi:hypothetical protein